MVSDKIGRNIVLILKIFPSHGNEGHTPKLEINQSLSLSLSHLWDRVSGSVAAMRLLDQVLLVFFLR